MGTVRDAKIADFSEMGNILRVKSDGKPDAAVSCMGFLTFGLPV